MEISQFKVKIRKLLKIISKSEIIKNYGIEKMIVEISNFNLRKLSILGTKQEML